MAKPRVDPLQYNVPIVDERGLPTPQFLRQWQMLLQRLEDAERRIVELEEGGP